MPPKGLVAARLAALNQQAEEQSELKRASRRSTGEPAGPFRASSAVKVCTWAS